MKSTPLRALVALLAGSASLVSVSCNQDQQKTAWWMGEQERISLEQSVALKNLRYDKAAKSGLDELERLRVSTSDVGNRLSELRSTASSLREEVDAMQADLPAFKEMAIRDHRQKAVGLKFATFETPTGKSFKDAQVVSVTDGGVTLRHSEGSARLSYEDLAEGQRAQFGLEADRALAAKEQEKRSAVEYERWLDSRVASMEQEKRHESALAAAKASEARARTALASARAAEANARTYASRALNQPSRRFGYYNYYGTSSYYRYRPTYYYYNTNPRYLSTVNSFRCYSPVRTFTNDRRVQYDRFNYAPNKTKAGN